MLFFFLYFSRYVLLMLIYGNSISWWRMMMMIDWCTAFCVFALNRVRFFSFLLVYLFFVNWGWWWVSLSFTSCAYFILLWGSSSVVLFFSYELLFLINWKYANEFFYFSLNLWCVGKFVFSITHSPNLSIPSYFLILFGLLFFLVHFIFLTYGYSIILVT